jgi:hypothetical protein
MVSKTKATRKAKRAADSHKKRMEKAMSELSSKANSKNASKPSSVNGDDDVDKENGDDDVDKKNGDDDVDKKNGDDDVDKKNGDDDVDKKNGDDDTQDSDLEMDESSVEVLNELSALFAMYAYAVPSSVYAYPPIERQVALQDTIQALVDDDLVKYKIPEAPAEMGAGKEPEAQEEEKKAWRMEQLRLEKRKAILAYGLKDLEVVPNDKELIALLERLEQDEEELDIHLLKRKPDITDEEWSDLKHKRIQEKHAKLDSDMEAAKKALESRQAQEAEEDAMELEEQRAIHKKAAEIVDPSGSWQAVDTQVQGIREEEKPKEIKTLHRYVCALILKWWDSKPDANDLKACNAINTRFKYIPGGEGWRFAPSELELWQTKVKTSLAICEEETANDDELLKLAQYVMTFTNKLRKAGLDWKMVCNKAIHRRVFTCLQSSEQDKVKNCTRQLESAYLAARKEQIQFFNAALPVIIPSLCDKGQINYNHLFFSLPMVENLNMNLGVRNLANGLPKMDHYFPIKELTDAKEYYEGGRHTEAENAIAKMLHKINLLGIPMFGNVQVSNGAKFSFDAMQARNEVLGISRTKDISHLVGDVPSVRNARWQGPYANAEMRTVGWGDHPHRFYINQYGPDKTPIWRRERHMSREWIQEYADRDPPLEYKVQGGMNRFGHRTNEVTGKKIYTERHIWEICGVAFTQGRSEDPLELIRPETYALDNPRRPDRWKNDYVLIGWDINLNGLDIERCWEPRSVLRERYGTIEADEQIFQRALECQQLFDKAQGTEKSSLDSLATGLKNVSLDSGNGMFVYPTTQGSEEENVSLDSGNGMFVYPTTQGSEKKNATSSPELPVGSRSSNESARDFFRKFRDNNNFNAEQQAAIMFQKFGKSWVDMVM